jgi:hypothetical protein
LRGPAPQVPGGGIEEEADQGQCTQLHLRREVR